MSMKSLELKLDREAKKKKVNLEWTLGAFTRRETGSQGICIQSRCEIDRKREGTFGKIMGLPILCPLPGGGAG